MNTRGCIYYIGANYAEGLITHPFIGEGLFYVHVFVYKQTSSSSRTVSKFACSRYSGVQKYVDTFTTHGESE